MNWIIILAGVIILAGLWWAWALCRAAGEADDALERERFDAQFEWERKNGVRLP